MYVIDFQNLSLILTYFVQKRPSTAPGGKTAEELQEEEELQLALALSQSEAEHKEKERKSRPHIAPDPTPHPTGRLTSFYTLFVIEY